MREREREYTPTHRLTASPPHPPHNRHQTTAPPDQRTTTIPHDHQTPTVRAAPRSPPHQRSSWPASGRGAAAAARDREGTPAHPRCHARSRHTARRRTGGAALRRRGSR
eukprot:1741296-Prymnesium_polylepis.3